MSAVRVLLVNHTGRVSGAEHSLLDLVRGLGDDVRPVVACPEGRLRDEVAALGVPWVRLRGTDAGLKLHPVGTPRAGADLLADGRAVRRAAARHGAAVVHANSTRAALVCAPPRLAGGPALVAHVHDVLGRDRVSRAVGRAIDACADGVLANSRHVATGLGMRRPAVTIVDNPVDLGRFDPARADRRATRAALGLREDTPAMIVVGQLTPWKGQDTAIRALAGLGPSACRLLVVGEPVFDAEGTRHDNLAYVDGLGRLARDLGVEDRVRFLGARDDVPALLAAADLALAPSWEEPFGRVVIEAMAMGVPVLATECGGPAEILAGGGGLLLAPDNPAAWSAAAARLLGDGAERRRVGAQGRRQAVSRYGLARFAAAVTGAWAAAQRARGSGRRRARAQLRAQRDEADAHREAEEDPQEDVAAGARLLGRRERVRGLEELR